MRGIARRARRRPKALESRRSGRPCGPSEGVREKFMTSTRDFIGYGRTPPHPRWPGNARVAVQFVINFEEGSEPSIPDGDEASETSLTEGPGRVGVGDT